MKRVAIVSRRPGTSNLLRQEVSTVLGERAEVVALSLEQGLPIMIPADVVLVTGRGWTSEVIRRLPPGINMLVTVRTIRRREWQQVMALPARTRLLVVHEDQDSAFELMSLLYELGVKHLEMTPYHPGVSVPDQVDVAITTGTPQFVPPGIFRVMNIGARTIDAGTILDVMSRLDLLDSDGHTRLLGWISETMPRSQGLRTTVEWLARLRRQHEAVLDHVQDAVVAVDNLGRVTFFNRQAELMFDLRAGAVVGRPAKEILPSLDVHAFLTDGEATQDRLLQVGRTEVMSTLVALREGEQANGLVATLRPVGAIWAAEERLRREAHSRGHRARYTFRDFQGQSETLRTALHQASRATRSTSAILIQGETGVGKEVLAQSIHNASPRAPYPFVAVNCAALPESLLESELFGYEEGAFTGARRGGKPGLFEQAHRGTIFLDEIGDVSPSLQARLLRVLENHEVLRVGGTRVVPVDIRVIAATNRNLQEMVDRGGFRADLFFRLNVLPLRLPPLRERPEDVPEIFRFLLRNLGYRGEVPEEVLSALRAYAWPGNVRELRNCAEYAVAMTDGVIQPEHLPEAARGRKEPGGLRATVLSAGGTAPASVPSAEGRVQLPPELLFLLTQVGEAGSIGRSAGRRSLAEAAGAAGLPLTEAEVRRSLKRLEGLGLVRPGRGRGGTVITEEGALILRSHVTERAKNGMETGWKRVH